MIIFVWKTGQIGETIHRKNGDPQNMFLLDKESRKKLIYLHLK